MPFTFQTERCYEAVIHSTSCTIVFNKYNVYKGFYDDTITEFPMNKTNKMVRLRVYRRKNAVKNSSKEQKVTVHAGTNYSQEQDGYRDQHENKINSHYPWKQCELSPITTPAKFVLNDPPLLMVNNPPLPVVNNPPLPVVNNPPLPVVNNPPLPVVNNPPLSVTFELVVAFDFPETTQIEGTTGNVWLLKKNARKGETKSFEMKKACVIEIVLVEFTDIFQILESLESGNEYSLSIGCVLVYNDQTLIRSIPMSSTQIHAKDFAQNIRDKFIEFFDNKDMCDIVILVEDTTICVHKIVLVSHSPVFEAMFTRDMKEKNESIVRITDVDTDIFRAFLRYMYTGSIESSVDDIPELLVLADRYQVNSLSNLCNACLSNKFENKTDYYFRHETKKNEYTSFVVDLKNFATKPSVYENFTCEFPMNIGDYSGKLQVSNIEQANLKVVFSTECQLLCKVLMSFVDTSGKKTETVYSMKRKDQTKLDFSMRNYKNYVQSDKSLKIHCEIIYIEVKTTQLPTGNNLRDENFGTRLQKRFETFFNEKQFCDLTIFIGESEIHAHKVILAQKSSVFKSLFAKEGSEKIKDTMTIEDTDFVTAKAFFGFMYTGSIDKNEKLIRDLLNLAQRYKVVNLEVLCQNYVKKYLDTTAMEALIATPLNF